MGSQVYRWTEVTGVVGLGFLDIDAGHPSGDAWMSGLGFASSDGSIVVGWETRGPFRWTKQGGLTSLGWINGGTNIALDAMSSDGRYVAASSPGDALEPFAAALWDESKR